MQEATIYTNNLEGITRNIGWAELNQLKKDILWIFDENGNQLHAAFVPDHSFTLPYWEYISLNGDMWFTENERSFYISGTMIIILCMVIEFIDLVGGSLLGVGEPKIDDNLGYNRRIVPSN